MQNKYSEILGLIEQWVADEVDDFQTMSKGVQKALNACTPDELVVLLEQTGIIPEKYAHDSTHEKLYAKMSDCVVTHLFTKLGLETQVIKERADSADVLGRSLFHNYSFAADAKVFRLSRTAKNQKDFKVNSMKEWKGDAEHAMIVCPFYQYPTTSSQIYSQVLTTGVALGSFEHLLFCFKRGVKESKSISLREIFSYPTALAKTVSVSERKQAANVMSALDAAVAKVCNATVKDVIEFRCGLRKTVLSPRAVNEIAYWETVLAKIKKMTQAEAQEALIQSLKIRSKIKSIGEFLIVDDEISDYQ